MTSTTSRFPRWEVRGRRGSAWRRISPAQLFVGSFLLLILIGTIGFKVLPGLYTGAELTWLDALFTATSAVCVTGLIVVDTATHFTGAGQAFILLLIQLGGLGIVTFTTLIIISLGRRLSLRHESLSASSREVAPHVDYQRLTRDIVLFTLTFELIGATILYAAWLPRFGAVGALWPAIFHAISAFCNAGFSTFSDSLMQFQTAPVTLTVVMMLIVLGGIGFLTLEELYRFNRARRRKAPYRISLHSRLVLAVTGLLLVSGWVLFSIFEWSGTLAQMPIWARPINSLFMSVTARTAGFNTVSYAEASTSSDFLTIILMMIGASPGSTGGGLKTTTVALIALLAVARFRGHEVTSVWGRSIPEETIQRAVGLFAVAFGVVTAAIFFFTSTEINASTRTEVDAAFLKYMFEAVSAFNTVGLSMGVTADLSTWGRAITVLLMFMGRVGPLTFAAAIALKRPTPAGEFRYAYEEVVVG